MVPRSQRPTEAGPSPDEPPRREARAIVQPPDDLHRLLIDTVQDYAIFALDVTGHIATWNPGAQRFKGYTAAEAIGQHFSIFYPPEDIAADKPGHELIVASEQGWFEDEGWRIRKDGTRFWANVVITALRDPTGRLVGFAKVTRDVSERQVALEALRQSEERFRLLVQAVRDYGILSLDPTGHVTSWNTGAEQILGYTVDEILGRHVSTFYPPDAIAEGKPELELTTATRVGRFEDEGWRIRKDGSRFWANVVVTALRDGRGAVTGFAKVTRDLTERRAREAERIADAERVAAAEAANRAKSEFLASMSHELRTPLNAIGGYSDLLLLDLRGPLTDEQREDIARIRRSQQHLLAIINDLLNYSRIEAGRVSYDIAPVSLSEVVDAAVTMMAPQATARQLTLASVGCEPALVARADRSKVEQIVINLVSNAVKFTDAGGRVTLSCAVSGDRVALSVRDTGVGIGAEDLEKIFEPFVQLGRTLHSAHEGTGLGLSISRDLARAMGGDLMVKSAPGAGSTFTLLLPRS